MVADWPPCSTPDIPLPGHLSVVDEIAWAQALAAATPQPRQPTWAEARDRKHQHERQAAAAAAIALDDYPTPPF